MLPRAQIQTLLIYPNQVEVGCKLEDQRGPAAEWIALEPVQKAIKREFRKVLLGFQVEKDGPRQYLEAILRMCRGSTAPLPNAAPEVQSQCTKSCAALSLSCYSAAKYSFADISVGPCSCVQQTSRAWRSAMRTSARRAPSWRCGWPTCQSRCSRCSMRWHTRCCSIHWPSIQYTC